MRVFRSVQANGVSWFAALGLALSAAAYTQARPIGATDLRVGSQIHPAG